MKLIASVFLILLPAVVVRPQSCPLIPDSTPLIPQVSAQAATATLIGHSEFTAPSAPPRKFRKLEVAGTIYSGEWTTATCPDSVSPPSGGAKGSAAGLALQWRFTFNPQTKEVTAEYTRTGGFEPEWYGGQYVWGMEVGLWNSNGPIGGPNPSYGTSSSTVTRRFISRHGNLVTSIWNGRHGGTGAAATFTPSGMSWVIEGASVLYRDEWLSAATFDKATGAVAAVASNIRYHEPLGGDFPLSEGGAIVPWSGFLYAPDHANAYGTGVQRTAETMTTRTYSGTNTPLGSGPYYKFSGDVEATLSDEDTEDDALDRALAGPALGAMPVAYRTRRTTGFSFEVSQFKLEVPLEIKCAGNYRIVFHVLRKRRGSADDGTPMTVFIERHFAVGSHRLKGDANVRTMIMNLDGETIAMEYDTEYVITRIELSRSCETAEAGASEIRRASVHVHLSLGRGKGGNSAGELVIESDSITSAVYSPRAIRTVLPVEGGTRAVNGADGTVRQVAAPSALADLLAISPSAFEIRFFSWENVGPPDPQTGVHSLGGAPFVSYKFENPVPSDENSGRLRITETRGAVVRVSEFQHDAATGAWTFSKGNGLRIETALVETVAGGRNETVTVKNADGTLSSVARREIRTFPWGEETTREVLDPGRVALETISEFNATPGQPGYGKLQQRYSSEGSWSRFEYDAAGRPTKSVRPFLNSARTEPESAHRVTTTTYGSLTDADGDELPEELVTVIETTAGQETSRSYLVNWSRPVALAGGDFKRRSDIRCTAPAAWNAPGQLVTETLSYLTPAVAGRPFRIINPDGTAEISTYARASDGSQTTVVSTGAYDRVSGSIVAGRRVTTFTNATGHAIGSSTLDIASGLALEEWTATAIDTIGRPTRLDYADGTFVLRDYACCGLLSERDRAGVITEYGYDDLGRRRTAKRHGLAQVTDFDADGRVILISRIGTDGSALVQERSTYDLAGRLIERRDALDRVTSFQVVTDSATGQTTRSTHLPGGGVRVETAARDGSMLSVGGSAAAAKRYVYRLEGIFSVTREISLSDTGAETEWTETFTDFAGRSCKSVYADGATASVDYNDLGQLARQTDPDGVTMLFAYDAQGRQEVAALDVDRDGVIDYAGTDRITRDRSVVAAKATAEGSVTVQRATVEIWEEAGVDSPVIVSVSEESVDGRRSWQTGHGLVSETRITMSGDGGTTTTTRAPDGTMATQVFAAGNLAAASRAHPDLGTLSSSTYRYDAHGRLEAVTDARNGATSYTYHGDDRIRTITTPDPDPARTGAGYDPQVTTLGYDEQGRENLVIQSDGTEVHTAYFPSGQVKRTWGSRIYPVEYGYDAQLRLKTLTTWQDFAGDSGKATTRWNYHAQRGWLTEKRYADDTGPSYTYTAAGRIKTRVWARGLVTTYNYSTAGQLEHVDYADSTPDVALQIDRQGRPRLIVGASGVRTLDYTGDGQLKAEGYMSGPLAGFSVGRSFDAMNRVERLAVASVTGNVYSVAYAFDAASRLKTVSRASNTASYRYVDQADLVAGVDFQQGGSPRLTTTRIHDRLNRLVSVDNQPAVGSPRQFGYTYNGANQRTRVTREDDSRWDYGYDALGQVTSASKVLSSGLPALGLDFGYSYDDIGNRRTSTSNGLVSTYAPNLLNQYEQKSVPGKLEVRGEANPGAVVTVTLGSGLPQPVVRQDERFYEQFAIDNQAAGAATRVRVTGVRNNVGPNGEDAVAEIERQAYVPQTPEIFIHDADGNLTSDARWNYGWDGENRLVSMETTAPAIAAGVVPKRYEFAYDGQSRRFAEKVYEWVRGEWTLARHTNFIYDGWNLLAELDAMKDYAVARSYVWGLDLSGTMQGAGGVGGLLFANLPGAPTPAFDTHAVAYDGNGNVTALVDQSTGTVSATYEYSAFGETLSAIGPAAEANPFRFSTKLEEATGLLHYGMRYYSPRLGRWLNRDPLVEQGGMNLYGFVVNGPIDHIDLLGLWSPAAHDALVQNAFGGILTQMEIDLLKSTGRAFDRRTQGVQDTHKHSMRRVGQDPEEAIRERENFISQTLRNARQLARGDCPNRDAALKLLAEALHPIMDSSSPLHTDANGYPKEWAWYKIRGHSANEKIGSETVRDLTPAILSSQKARLNAAFDAVFGP